MVVNCILPQRRMNVMQVSIRQIQYIVSIARERSFARAAAELNLSPSALSHSIKLLEQQIGLKLFKRNRLDVRVTPEGEEIVNRAFEVMHRASDFTEAIRRIAVGTEGEVSFGFGTNQASAFLPQLLLRLMGKYPKLRCRVEVRNPWEFDRSFGNNSIEFAVCGSGNNPAGCVAVGEEITRIAFQTLVRDGHPLTALSDARLTDLRDFPLLISNVSGNYQRFVNLLDNSLRDRLHKVEDTFSLRQVVLRSDAVWLFAPSQMKSAGLVSIEFRHDDLASETSAVVFSPVGRTMSRSAAIVIEELRALMREGARAGSDDHRIGANEGGSPGWAIDPG